MEVSVAEWETQEYVEQKEKALSLHGSSVLGVSNSCLGW